MNGIENFKKLGKVLSKSELKSINGGGWTVYQTCNNGTTYTFLNVDNGNDDSINFESYCGSLGVASQVWVDNGLERAS